VTALPPGIAPLPDSTDPAVAERSIATHRLENHAALRSRFAADRAAPPPSAPAPASPVHIPPLTVVGPAGLPLAPDTPIGPALLELGKPWPMDARDACAVFFGSPFVLTMIEMTSVRQEVDADHRQRVVANLLGATFVMALVISGYWIVMS
jgi:hypothetical protein